MKKEETNTIALGKQQKLTYDELNNACCELSQQNQRMDGYIKRLTSQVGDLSIALQSRRFDYMFMVLDHKEFFSEDFLKACAKEISDALLEPANPEAPVSDKSE